jgi:RNA polymerase sigma factor (sigma-70 family)
MSSEKEETPAGAADGEAHRADQDKSSNQANGNGHPAQEGGPRGKTALPAPASQAVLAARDAVLGCRAVAEWEARRQFRLCGRSMPQDELIGEAQLALMEAAGRYDPGRDVPVGAFVTLVVRRRLIHAVDRWNKWRRPHPVCFTDVGVADGATYLPEIDPPCLRTPEPVRAAAAQELLERVRRVMPELLFRVLWLHVVQGCRKEEIAGQIGVTRQRVQQLIRNAIERAKRHFPEECDAW